MTTVLLAAADESQPVSALDPLNGPPPFTVGPGSVNVPVEEIERAFAGRTAGRPGLEPLWAKPRSVVSYLSEN